MQQAGRRFVYAAAAIALGSLLLLAAIWSIVQERVNFEYRQSVTDIVNGNANLSLLMEARTRAVLRNVDQAIRFVRRQHRVNGADVNLEQLLRDVNINTAEVKAIFLVGPDGAVVQTPGAAALAIEPDRELLAQVAADDTDSFHIGRTMSTQSGALLMQVARPIVDSEGNTSGAVVAILDPAQLTSIYGETSLGRSDALLLIGLDGIVRIRRAGSAVSFGQDLTKSELLGDVRKSPTGMFETPGTTDGTRRYLTYRKMSDFPLVVAVGTGEYDAFASFRGHRRSYYAVATMATLALLVLAGVLLRTLDRQRKAVVAIMRNESRFHATFDQAFVGMAQASPEGVLFQVNRVLCEITGYTEQELVGRTLAQVLHQDDRASPALRPDAGVSEARLVRKDGRIAWANVATTRVRDAGGGTDCLVIVVQDITDFKRIDRMKSEFVSIVSHELRTPLTSIRGSLGLIAGGVAGTLPDAASSLIDIANNNCERLIRLINDILDTEKIESGKMTFDMRELDLVELVRAAVAANDGFAAQHQVHLTLDAPTQRVPVRADADRLMQAVTNLLSNATKFSPASGEVRIRIESRGARARVDVRDQGPGIPPEFRERIFQKFSQADSSDTRQKGGTGLGLNISKAIIERMGGEIGFASVMGSGTTFHFELPAVPDRAARPAPPAARPRVLVCEDDPDIARLIGMMLDKAGYDTELAYTAAEARRMALAARYDAVTVDLKLPDEPGISLIRALHRMPQTRDLPVIVISAVADEGRVELNGEELPISDWLQKPIDENRLARAVRRAVADAVDGMARVLHVEDDPDIQRIAAAVAQDFATFEFASAVEEARALLGRWRYDLVLLDLELPDGTGWELLHDVRKLRPPPPVVIFSVHEVQPDDRARVAAVLLKSHTSNEELLATIRRVLGCNRPQAGRA